MMFLIRHIGNFFNKILEKGKLDKMKNNNLFVFSYYSNIESSVMSEWLKDKIYSLISLDYKVTLFTSTINPKLCKSHEKLKVIRIPSLAPSIFLKELKSNFRENAFIHLAWLPLVITIGSLFEIFERITLKRMGHGLFSWAFLTTLMFFFNF